MVTYKEKTQTYKFQCFVPENSKRQIWTLGSRIVPLVIVIIIVGLTKGLPKSFFNFEHSMALLLGIISLLVLIYAVSYSIKRAILTYDEIILMKGRIGLLKARIPYNQIKELEIVALNPRKRSRFFTLSYDYVSPYVFWKDKKRGDEESDRGEVVIKTHQGKMYKLNIERPEMFERIVREKVRKFKPSIRAHDGIYGKVNNEEPQKFRTPFVNKWLWFLILLLVVVLIFLAHERLRQNYRLDSGLYSFLFPMVLLIILAVYRYLRDVRSIILNHEKMVARLDFLGITETIVPFSEMKNIKLVYINRSGMGLVEIETKWKKIVKFRVEKPESFVELVEKKIGKPKTLA